MQKSDRLTRISLIQRVKQQQDAPAWEEFVSVYKNYLYVVIRNMNISHHDTEEIVQTVILKVWEKLPEFDYTPLKGRFRSWICSIARNQVIDFCRARKSRLNNHDRASSDPSSPIHFDLDLGNSELDEIAEREWRNYLANLALEAAEKKFGGKTLECFKLDLAGISPPNIAAQLDIAENSVYVYRSRVQNFVRAELAKLDDLYD